MKLQDIHPARRPIRGDAFPPPRARALRSAVRSSLPWLLVGLLGIAAPAVVTASMGRALPPSQTETVYAATTPIADGTLHTLVCDDPHPSCVPSDLSVQSQPGSGAAERRPDFVGAPEVVVTITVSDGDTVHCQTYLDGVPTGIVEVSQSSLAHAYHALGCSTSPSTP